MCRVSVIVPIYQVEPYLPRCVDSILAQTFPDFELILVDDGTKDGCPAIMRRYAEADSRIREVHKENGGLSSARNAGLDVACGEFIVFVDADDYIDAHLLEDAVCAADAAQADQVLWNYQLTDEQGAHGAYLDFPEEVIDLEKLGLANYFYRYWMPYRHGQEAWTKLYRRDIIERHHLRYQPNNEIFAEDTLFSAMYLLHTRVIAALPKPYVYYVQRGDSIMAMRKPRLARRLFTLAIRLTEYADQVGKGQALADVLPVLCYDKLLCKGIRLDPDEAEMLEAMRELGQDATLRRLLRALLGVSPLLMYTWKTRKGFMTQLRGRLFAARWLRGDVRGAAALVQGREAQK